jgi:hypothetical protein
MESNLALLGLERRKIIMKDLNKEVKTFKNMKKMYPNLLKYANFNEGLNNAINDIQSQLDGGYIDVSGYGGGELIFEIIKEGFKLWKDKNGFE